ncbi:MAG: D-2-hydroxyacid dehydrogenase [Candidatus Hydrogenedentes bacterium]|nr:D-2-hydroxyacid dehydrogenase [Candidatus Hydrogenedentota bacterium]
MAAKNLLLFASTIDTDVARIRAEMPELNITVGDRSAPDAPDLVRQAHIIYGHIPRDLFVHAEQLEWIHLMSQGADNMLYQELVESPVILTCGRGSFSQACAEQALMMTLALYRDLPLLLRHQRAASWRTEPVEFDLLAGKTVASLGTGSIGDCVAKLYTAFGCRMLGFNRTGRNLPLFEKVYAGRDGLHELLAESDVVVNSLPLTSTTYHIIGPAECAAMKPGTLFINVGRGGTVDERSLIDAIQSGRIVGAGLDVTEHEPLSPDSVLWRMDNVLVTSHTGGRGGDDIGLSFNLLVENLRRYLDGKPLLHQVDKQAGY